jgi:hypothetical protein
MHLTFRDLFSVSTCHYPSRLHVQIMHCLRTISSPGTRKVKNTSISVHKLPGFKNNVHSHTPKEYCSKPMYQLCKLRFVLMMQAELPVKRNAFQTQKYRAFHIVLRNYKHLQQEKPKDPPCWNCSQPQENWLFLLLLLFTTRDVRCVHHGWHGTHRYDIQVIATHRTWISYRCVPCHPWCTHRTSLVVKKKIHFSCGCEKFH